MKTTFPDGVYVDSDLNGIATASSLEALLSVTLDPESKLAEDYAHVFYPKAKPLKGSATHRKHYFQLVKYLAEVSACVNSYLAQCRYLTISSEALTTTESPLLRNDLILKNMDQLNSAVSAESVNEAVKAILGSMNSGKAHIIRPSTKFKDGFDIIYSGLPSYAGSKATAVSLKTSASIGYTMAESTSSYLYKEMANKEGGRYGLPISAASFSTANGLLGALFGDTQIVSLENIHTRRTAILPMDFDFKGVFAKASKNKAMSDLHIEFGDVALPVLEPEILKGLGKYFSIVVVREANHLAVRTKLRDASATGESLGVSQEAMMLQPEIGFSIVMHLPAEICGFITQTTSGEQIPLTALNTWASIWSAALLKAPKQRQKGQKEGGGGRLTPNNIPRYIIPASGTSKLISQRKALGFYSEAGRTNEDNLYVSSLGTFNYCPKADDLALDNAKSYELLMETALKLSFDAGTPLNASQIGETNPVFGLANPDYRLKISALKQSLKKYSGSLQTYSWDYNCLLTSSLSDPDKLIATDLSGTVRPDELAISDYLRKPFAKSMSLLFPSANSEGKRVTEDSFGNGGAVTAMLKTSPFLNLFRLYIYLLSRNAVPDFKSLVDEAAKSMEMKALTDELHAPYERNLYNGILTETLGVAGSIKDAQAEIQVNALNRVLVQCLRDSSGHPGSNLARYCFSTGAPVDEDSHFFDPEKFTLAEFKNVYSYLGGRIFLMAMKRVLMVDKKVLMKVDIDAKEDMLNYTALVGEVMPLITVLSKYVPDAEEIYEKADALAEGNKRDTSIGPDDIKVPGSKEGFQMFPHQVAGHQFLRSPRPPRFAVLDVAPGGGKTIELLTDVAHLISVNKIDRPAIICPNGLVKNWVEDMHLVTQGKWNLIPITTATYKTWGDERLTEMLAKAPRNTIVVIGASVLKLRPYPVVIGNHVEKVSGTLEFVKKFGFDYIALDESHRAKNPKTALHKAVKQLTTASCVKYVRLATGTLISNKLTDIVGQAALFSSQIFRTPEEYEKENSEYIGDSKVSTWKRDTPKNARAQLSRHVAVISAKRKEWAFMLPVPQETFIPVSMAKSEAEGGAAHQLMYDAILKETLEEIKADQDVTALLAGHDSEVEGGDDDEDDENGNGDPNGSNDDLDDATLAELESRLEPYLARLEQLLSDPLGDPFGEIYFKGLNESDFVSNKVLKIIERIRLSFVDYPWKKGATYKTRAVCDVGPQRYVLMAPPGVDISDHVAYYAEYQSKMDPELDPRWKKEPRGKVLVFCRYTRTVNAIYRALPADLKAIAVKFHGEVKNKWENLDAFKATPISKTKGIQILIANEQAISEGHNLQMADRMIRVEAPWAPGELDQSSSRIFRPDPSGKFSRENIYLDWVLTNGSLEVAKMGRLISKMLIKAQFDEADNPLYENINNDQLPLIRMSLDMIASVPLIDNIMPYIEAYQDLASIQSEEFKEMRATRPSTMFDIEPTPMFEGAKLIEYTPYIPNLRVPDRHNFGLVKLTEYMQDNDNPEVVAILKDKENLVGMYAHTEMGNGTIVKVNLTRQIKDSPETARKISRVYVKLVGSEEIYDGDPSMVHLATNLDENSIKNFALSQPWATKGDIARAARLDARQARKAESEARRQERSRAKELAALILGKKIKALKKAKLVAPPVEVVEEEEELNNNVELFPVVYNDFLALEVIPEDDEIDLTAYGFKRFEDYAYLSIKDYVSFTAVIAFLESKFTLSAQTAKRLDILHDSFVTGRGRKFAVEQAPISQLKNFYILRHKPSVIDKGTRKPELKVYPVILNGTLLLNVDIATNPAIRRVLNKVIPGTRNVKFEQASGLDIKFFGTKNEMIRKINELKKEGFIITNQAELKKAVTTLTLKKSSV